MSYIYLPKAPGFRKAVFSLWFKVPAASIAAAKEAYSGKEGTPLDGIIPLVVMGDRGTDNIPTKVQKTQVLASVSGGYMVTGYSYEQTASIIGPCPEHGIGSARCKVVQERNLGATYMFVGPSNYYMDVPQQVPSGEPPEKTNPTCIGVDCNGSSATLYVNFETKKKPEVSNYAHNRTYTLGEIHYGKSDPPSFMQGTRTYTGCSIPFGLAFPFYDVVEESDMHEVSVPDGWSTGSPVVSFVDISKLIESATGSIYSDQIKVTPDVWHHVLVSVDLKDVVAKSEAVLSAAKLQVALDDTNYIEGDLSSNWLAGTEPNDIVTDGAWRIYRTRDDPEFGAAHYSLAGPAVLAGKPMGLPATSEFVENIYHVEMAEFQMWTGITVDTEDVGRRRAFIDYKRDKAGKQISNDLQPVNPKKAADMFRKKQTILLHGSSKWIKGKNTGTTGITVVGGKPVEKPDGQFIPAGVIKKYKPEPELGVA